MCRTVARASIRNVHRKSGATRHVLRAGDQLGSMDVVRVELVPYGHDFTYDILPASDSGTYFAGVALVGSTLAPAVDVGIRVSAP